MEPDSWFEKPLPAHTVHTKRPSRVTGHLLAATCMNAHVRTGKNVVFMAGSGVTCSILWAITPAYYNTKRLPDRNYPDLKLG